jgi:hypothetical protein
LTPLFSFGKITRNGISNSYSRFSKKMRADKTLHKEVNELIDLLIKYGWMGHGAT